MKNLVEQTWTKGKNKIELSTWTCECGGNIVDVGSAGCSHDDDWTYFGQCVGCMRVYSHHSVFQRDDMEGLGWKLEEKRKREKNYKKQVENV